MPEIGRRSQGTTRKGRTPKHLTKIAITSDKYFELKVYIKSIVLPGTPAYECKRLGSGANKQAYRLWLHRALEKIGPKFFPSGARGLTWPRDFYQIGRAVHRVVRVLSIGIRKSYKRRELRDVQPEAGREEAEMAQDDELYEGAAGNTGAEEDAMVLSADEAHVEQAQEEKVMALRMPIEQENQYDNAIEEGADAEPIELEDLLGLMKPELFSHFPDLADEYFDWDEIMDPKCPEPIARLLLLLS